MDTKQRIPWWQANITQLLKPQKGDWYRQDGEEFWELKQRGNEALSKWPLQVSSHAPPLKTGSHGGFQVVWGRSLLRASRFDIWKMSNYSIEADTGTFCSKSLPICRREKRKKGWVEIFVPGAMWAPWGPPPTLWLIGLYSEPAGARPSLRDVVISALFRLQPSATGTEEANPHFD